VNTSEGFEIQEPDYSVPRSVVDAEEVEDHELIRTECDFDIRESENPGPAEVVYAGEIEIWYR
jgi:hypothetical protein